MILATKEAVKTLTSIGCKRNTKKRSIQKSRRKKMNKKNPRDIFQDMAFDHWQEATLRVEYLSLFSTKAGEVYLFWGVYTNKSRKIVFGNAVESIRLK